MTIDETLFRKYIRYIVARTLKLPVPIFTDSERDLIEDFERAEVSAMLAAYQP